MASSSRGTISYLDSILPTHFSSDAARFEVKEAAQRLVARLETPFERAWTLAYETPSVVAAIQTTIDLGIWKEWTKANKEKPDAAVNLQQLVKWANQHVETNLLRRLTRILATRYILEETDEDTWKPTLYSLSLGDTASHAEQVIQCSTDHIIPCGLNLPRFLKKYNYREPIDLTEQDNYRDMTGGCGFFDACEADPKGLGTSFIGFMAGIANYKMDWTEVYNTNRIIDGADLEPDKPLFVDIGGGHGLDSSRLLAKHPTLPAGVVVLQDTPEVVALLNENLDSRIVRQSYDFFTPQPRLHARAYFFHAVPHDWPDADCVRMFSQVKDAFKPGYSKLLIYEIMLPKKGATTVQTTIDILLMKVTSGMERTEEQWRRLLGQAGFKIIGVSRHPTAVESVIEADLAQEAD